MSGPESLSFPDGPRGELEETIATLLAQGRRVIQTQGRLRALLHANQSVVEQIDLPQVLQRVVQAAVELVEAGYGAMGVLTPERDGLEQFLFVGMSAEQAAAIGPPPQGHGLLGALITDPRPIRLERMAGDPRGVGFPPNHPPMDSFLGVPIRVRGEVFGNLYLTESRHGSFTDEDEQLVVALATTAGYAIENARLFAESEARGRWSSAAAELASAILSTPTELAFDLLASRVHEVSRARSTWVVLTEAEDAAAIVAAVRDDPRLPAGTRLSDDSPLLRRVLEDGRTHAVGRSAGETDVLRVGSPAGLGPALAVPLRSRTRLRGAVVVARDVNEARFTAAEIDSATDLVSRAAIAVELESAREDAQRAMLADDRRRIARDLHDHVIQQLFGTGLALQGIAGRLGPGGDADTVADAVDQLDDAIRQIRTVVFALSGRGGESSVRHRLLDVVAEMSAHGRHPAAIRFTGPVDHLVRDGLASDVVAVGRELLSNAVHHSGADRISLELSADEDHVAVVVADDGRGIPEDAHRRGLQNLEERAAARGGTFDLHSTASGTTATWTVPFGSPDTSGGGR